MGSLDTTFLLALDRELAKLVAEDSAHQCAGDSDETLEQCQVRRCAEIRQQLDDFGVDFVQGLWSLYASHRDATDAPVSLPAWEDFCDQIEAACVESEWRPMQDHVGFSDEQMAWLFELACRRMEAGDLETAPLCFRAITLLNPDVGDFWLGLGEAYEAKGDASEALDAYLMALHVEPLQSDGYLQAARLANEQQRDDIVEAILEHAEHELQDCEDQDIVQKLQAELFPLKELLQPA